jgi:hypothetical protein
MSEDRKLQQPRDDVETMIADIRAAGENADLVAGDDPDTPVDLQGNLAALNAGYHVGRAPGRGLRRLLYPFGRYLVRPLIDELTAFNSGVVRVLNQVSQRADIDKADLEQRVADLETAIADLKADKDTTCE